VRGILQNGDKKLLPGMFANITVKAGAPVEVVTVPRTAITFSLYGDSIFVAKPAPPTQAAFPKCSGWRSPKC
jgi:multidrug efflux pump subunit AcrA (membrane-fusion protein)